MQAKKIILNNFGEISKEAADEYFQLGEFFSKFDPYEAIEYYDKAHGIAIIVFG